MVGGQLIRTPTVLPAGLLQNLVHLPTGKYGRILLNKISD